MSRPAVFLDRDNTLNENDSIRDRMRHPGYLQEVELVALMPGAAAGCARLKRAEFVLVIVTNQSSVARGWCSVEAIEAVNARVRELLRAEGGADVDAVYTALHCAPPEGVVAPWNVDNDWRKPGPGMILTAAREIGLDLTKSWMIGDAQRDVDAAINAGIALERTILVEGGRERPERAGHRARNMLEAAAVVIGA